MLIEINVDARDVIARFSATGIPLQVRNNLRRIIPGLLKELQEEVDANLSALKSRTNLQDQTEMIENADGITGRLSMIWTGPESSDMVPQVLETGAKPHVIEAKNANALTFFWPVMARQVFFKKVNHPGFPGINYMKNAFDRMEPVIRQKIEEAVREEL